MSKIYRNGILAVTAACVGLASVGPVAVATSAAAGERPGVSAAVGRHERGGLVSAEQLRTFTAEQAREWLASDDFDAGKVRYGVDAHRLVYRTVDPHGRPTIASGLLVLPRNSARRLATVSFTHGTELYRPDAPSTATDVWGWAPAVMYGAAGFAAVMPDYLGMGLGPGMHPWMDVPTETSASLETGTADGARMVRSRVAQGWGCAAPAEPRSRPRSLIQPLGNGWKPWPSRPDGPDEPAAPIAAEAFHADRSAGAR
jgi:hypothetical protein